MTLRYKEIDLDHATAGLVLAEAILDASGKALLPKGATLSDSMLASLRRRGIDRIIVIDAILLEEPETEQERVEKRLTHLFRKCESDRVAGVLRKLIMEYRLEEENRSDSQLPRKNAPPTQTNRAVQQDATTPQGKLDASAEKGTTIALARVVKNIRDLPSPSGVIIDVLRSFEQKDVSTSELADKMTRDQALAAKTIRIANSSFYGLQHKVTTIQQAITVLGFDSVRTLIMAASITDLFTHYQHAMFDFKTFWLRSVGTAVCAKMLARHLNADQDYAFISGLLHDIGTLVLATGFPEEYEAAIRHRNMHDCHELDAEQTVLGIDHTTVGQALAQHWKFPILLQAAIANHHAPTEDDYGSIPSIVHAADAIVHALGLIGKDDDLVPAMVEQAWNSLKIEPEAFKLICHDTESEFEKACQILTV